MKHIDPSKQRGPETGRNQAPYDESTHYRLFWRCRDEETGEIERTIHGAWLDEDEAARVFHALRRDTWSMLFVRPGEPDPTPAGRMAERERQSIIRDDARIDDEEQRAR